MDFYSPTVLFRQNAIRRMSSPSPLPRSLPRSLPNSLSDSLAKSWLLHNNPSDTELTQKACSLDRLNIKSNYWKIPDCDMNLSALAVSDVSAASPMVAISSANADANLFIYELDTLNQYLTHHTTISLPNIHGLAWVPEQQLRFLVSGNNKGYAHLVSVPLPASRGGGEADESAEIIKRFNHRKHLRSVNKDPTIYAHSNTCVSTLGFAANDSLVSIYDDTLFVWNMNDCTSLLRPRPELISVVPGLRHFDVNPVDPNTLAICGLFGPSLYDTRCASYSVPQARAAADPRSVLAGLVKWHPSNEHVMACAHDDGVVRLWDVRCNETFSEISGHRGKQVTTMAWNHGDFFTGASDGNIVHWDLTLDVADLGRAGEAIQQCTLKEGINSVSFDATSNTIVDKLHERQCGTLLPALNNRIVAMCQVGGLLQTDCNILSIDTLAFLGLHLQIYDAVSLAPEKQYYSKDDLVLITATEGSNSTLIGSCDSLIAPLSLKHQKHHDNSSLLNQCSRDVPAEVNFHARNDSRLSVPSLHSVESLPASVQSMESLPVSLHSVESLPVSLHSVESLPVSSRTAGSPSLHSEELPNSLDSASVYSVSTLETVVGAPEDTDKVLLAFLDTELDRICSEFRTQTFFI